MTNSTYITTKMERNTYDISRNEPHNELYTDGQWIKDRHGRTVMLRGVNVSGNCKRPTSPDPITEENLYDHRNVSFVGRPFPLAEADEHFARLRRWGLNFIRLVVTWEAIEHAGPGQYDEAYLDYIAQIVQKAGEYDISVFIDPHQDVWSRLSGGDGAPGWTFEVAGLDITKFRQSGAATIYPFDEEPFIGHWLTNYTLLASATMFTLFFGSEDFAPDMQVNGESVQSYLQRHYINAFLEVARRVGNLPNVVGFGSMNEPSCGFIGRHMHTDNEELYMRRLGLSPTPYEAILLGAGYPQDVKEWSIGLRGFIPRKTVRMNPNGVRVWEHDRNCIWHEHNVWDVDHTGHPKLLRPHYFTHVMRNGQPYRIDFGRDYLRPFINRFASELRKVAPDTIMFIETVPRLKLPRWGPDDTPNIINASHWYDVVTLFTRMFLPFLNMDIRKSRLVVGTHRVQRMFADQLGALKRASVERLGGTPTLVGEFGISYNMPFGINYLLNWFGMQEHAINASFEALEHNLLNGTLWNYTPDNTNRDGDGWNREDLSIFSRNQQTHKKHKDGHMLAGDGENSVLDDGGRALSAVVRPYPYRTAGEPVHMAFDWRRHRFTMTFRHSHDPHIQEPTEIFFPTLHYPDGYGIEVSDGTYQVDKEHQRLYYWHSTKYEYHTIHMWRA
jgi:hypothetical protein